MKSGAWDWIRTAPNMPIYFLARFMPWSVLLIGVIVDVFGKDQPGRVRGLPDAAEDPRGRTWMIASLLFPVVVVVFFSLSAGKRADYIASAFAPAG